MIATTSTANRVTAEQARLIGEDFVLDRLGDQVTVGDPWPIHSALGSAWVTPLVLTSSSYGPVGVIGGFDSR